MNCEQFQRVLPQIIESGGNPEEEDHLRTCEACKELVRDLKYIAEQAKLLLPLRDPNPRVWKNIQQSLAREGLVPEGRMSLTGQTPATPKKKSWTPPGIVLAVLAVLLLTVLLINYQAAPQPDVTAGPANGQTANTSSQPHQ